MVKNRLKIIFLLLLALSVTTVWAQKVTCSVSKTQFSLQEQIQITFTFEDIKNSPRSVDLKMYDTFSIVGGPYSSTNYSWINGKSTSTNKISYDIIAKKAGKLLIPPYEFKIKNETFTTNPIAVIVGKVPAPDVQGENTDLPSMFLQTVLDKKTYYQGETFSLTYKLYTAETVVNYTTSPMSNMDGFIIDRFELNNSPVSSHQVINGKEYLVADIATLTLTPTASGEVVLPSKPFRISVRQSGKSRTIFDDPFFGTNTRDMNIVSPSDTINVLPLPVSAGPVFTGAIGEFTMSVVLDSTVIRENRATALHVKLKGHGNFEHFTFPEQAFPDGFEVFEPKVENEYKLGTNDYSGTRSWEYVLIPSKPGTFKFNDIRFTYFSPELGAYKTLEAKIPDLKVITFNELQGDYRQGISQDEVRLLSKDIRFIQMEEGRTVDSAYDPVKDPKNWLLFYLSAALVLLFIALELLWRFQMKNRDKVLYKNALKNALQRFNSISDEMEPAAILMGIETAFRDYLSAKHLDESAHALIPDIIKTIETYKYAPGMLSHLQLNELKTKALAVIEEMETV